MNHEEIRKVLKQKGQYFAKMEKNDQEIQKLEAKLQKLKEQQIKLYEEYRKIEEKEESSNKI